MCEHMLSVFRVAYAVLNDRHDAEDITQDTFLAYDLTNEEYESEEHIRRWLLAVAVNKAKNLVKSAWKRKNRPIEELEETGAAVGFSTEEDRNLLEAVAELPLKVMDRAPLMKSQSKAYPPSAKASTAASP